MKRLKNKTYFYLDLLLVLGIIFLCYLTFFHHLGEFAIRLWDEGRNGTNAVEMLKGANWLVPTFNYQVDMWNVKPPLHIWILVLFFKIFGISELSLRLPSAIAASIVVVGVFFVGRFILKKRWVGFLASLIILSSMGFPEIHIGRTGDYDALLVMWVFGAIVFSFLYLEYWKKKYLILATIFWLASVMTKGVAGLLMVPGLFLYSLFSKKFFILIKDKKFWIALFGLLVLISSYYLCREYINPGYLAAVWKGDLFGRYKMNVGSGTADFWYYWKLMASFRFQKWIYLVPISIVSYFLVKKDKNKNLILLLYLSTVSYFVVISAAQTKQYWYDAQLYPLASLLVAILLITLLDRVPLILKLFPILVLAFYTQRYIRTNLAYINRPDLDKDNACIKYGYLFRETSIDKGNFKVVHSDEECFSLHFYTSQNNLVRKNILDISKGDKVLSCNKDDIEMIKKKWKIENIFVSQNGCEGMKIK